MISQTQLKKLEAAQETADQYGIDLYAMNLRVEYDVLTKGGWMPKPAKTFRNVMGFQAWANRNPVRVVNVTAN